MKNGKSVKEFINENYEILETNLKYNEALSKLDIGLGIGRIDAKELHYLSTNKVYCVLYEDGLIKKNMLDKVSDKSKNNWCLIKLHNKVLQLINK